MIIASSGSPFSALAETGVGGLVGTISMRVVTTGDVVVIAPSTTAIIELLDGADPTGDYIAARTAPAVLTTTEYVVQFSLDGSFDPETVLSENLTVVVGVVVPELPPIPGVPGFGPQSGPCTAWVASEDVALCCSADVGTDVSVYDDAVGAASQLLFELSGRQFSGICAQTVRPCADGCGCWGALLAPLSPGAPQYPVGFSWGLWGGLGWGWGYEGCGNVCGCGTLSRALLPGYPVTSITQVLVDGVVIDPAEYRLDDYRWLTRMADANGNPQFWPQCQRLDLPDTEVGTWAVTATFGQNPPLLGTLAARDLACEIFQLCPGGSGECAIPDGAVRVTRQGIEIVSEPFIAWGMIKGIWATSVPSVNQFLSAYNPAGLRRRTTLWSPDLPAFAQRLGTGSGS